MRFLALHLLLSGCVAAGAVTGDGIRLPVEPTKPAPPAPMPGAVSKLPADSLYVIDSDVEVLVLASPEGVVSVSQDAGPLKIRGRFVDGSGNVETRAYKGKQVYVVEAAKTGRVELLVVPVGSKVPADVVRRTLDVDAGQGPQPPPIDPKVDPKPEPKVDPAAPIPAPGLRVLVVYESATVAQLTAGQQAAIYGKATRDLLNAKCVLGPDGKTREWRIYDQDVDAAADSKLWGDAMKRPRKSLPWLILSNGVGGFEGPLVDAEQVASLVKQFGG